MTQSFLSCIPYLAHLGKEQIVQITKRRSIHSILKDPNLNPEFRNNLEFVLKVRDFGIQELALSPEGGFEYYVELDREEVGWNVSASWPLEFKSYTWWFPIAGEVPYKGFFNYNMAKKEEESLKSLGLDTRIRAIGGYSTLGWFSDPLYSIQLQWSKPNLAGLVLHEMAHATVYIPDETQFNESYASFVETVGVEIFYKKTNPQDPEFLKELSYRSTKKQILKLIQETAHKLDTIYKSNLTIEEKKVLKQQTIDSFKKEAIYRGFIRDKDKETFLKKDWNNEDFIGVLRYKSGEKFFQSLLERCNYNFAEFHKAVMEFKDYPKEKKQSIME